MGSDTGMSVWVWIAIIIFGLLFLWNLVQQLKWDFRDYGITQSHVFIYGVGLMSAGCGYVVAEWLLEGAPDSVGEAGKWLGVLVGWRLVVGGRSPLSPAPWFEADHYEDVAKLRTLLEQHQKTGNETHDG